MVPNPKLPFFSHFLGLEDEGVDETWVIRMIPEMMTAMPESM
jgi:hypothetical protein